MARTAVPVTEMAPVKAALTTSLAGTNNDLTYTSRLRGPGGNSIRVSYIDPGGVTATQSVSVEGYDIIVSLARAASAISSTATQISTAIAAHSDASQLVTVANAGGNDGTGIVTALAATNLTGGALEVAEPSLTNGDPTNGMYVAANDGTFFLEAVETSGTSRTVTMEYGPHYATLVDVAGTVVTVPGNATRWIPLQDTTAFRQNIAGDVYFTPSTADLDFRAWKLPRTL